MQTPHAPQHLWDTYHYGGHYSLSKCLNTRPQHNITHQTTTTTTFTFSKNTHISY